jgi:hypothetical protein
MKTAKDIRRENLRSICRELGSISKVAIKINRSQPQVSHLICCRRTKNIGNKLATHIENIFNKPQGWLSQINTDD